MSTAPGDGPRPAGPVPGEPQDAEQPGRPADRESGGGAEAFRQGAHEQGAERRRAGEHESVEAHDPAAQAVGDLELQGRIDVPEKDDNGKTLL